MQIRSLHLNNSMDKQTNKPTLLKHSHPGGGDDLILLGHYVYFPFFRSEKIQNLMRKDAKKTFEKNPIKPIFGKVNEGDEIKKHWTNF